MHMTNEQLIHHMQCWLFRNAQTKWRKSPKETAELFDKFSLFKYIEDCYEILHVSSYQSALNDLEEILSANGVNVYA